MKHLLSAGVFLLALLPSHAEPPAERLELMFVPYALHFKPPKDPAAPSFPPQCYPLTPNRVSDCLPGELYDVRGYFEELGAKFGSTGIAWFNPSSGLLAVRAPPADVDFVEELIFSTLYHPPTNLQLKGEVVVQSAGGVEVPPTHRRRWDIYMRSGNRSVLSGGGRKGLSYSCNIEAVVGPDGRFFEYSMEAKVTFDGRKYSVMTTATVPLAKPHSLLLGTTPTGDEVRLQITLELQEPHPASPVGSPANQETTY